MSRDRTVLRDLAVACEFRFRTKIGSPSGARNLRVDRPSFWGIASDHIASPNSSVRRAANVVPILGRYPRCTTSPKRWRMCTCARTGNRRTGRATTRFIRPAGTTGGLPVQLLWHLEGIPIHLAAGAKSRNGPRGVGALVFLKRREWSRDGWLGGDRLPLTALIALRFAIGG
jgi:hypothetical protein